LQRDNLNLIIDIGNTRTKIAIANKNNFVFKETFPTKELSAALDKIIQQFSNLKTGILSSVIHTPVEVAEKLNSICNLIVFDAETKIPIKNKYLSPETLGKDRLAAAIGAWSLFQNSNTLIIDAGTCLKIDFINSSNEYCGGMISPGLKMRFNALHTFTDKLPLIDDIQKKVEIIGNTTETSLLSGVINGMNFEINGFISNYLNKYPDLKIVCTGGDINFFELEPKNCIFARPDLVMEGLNEIVNYNANQ
jgi:type III pantothenate kinase